MSYDILREKWIPMSDGQKLSLWECLENAHDLERISCVSPLETYAVHRFLCAFVMDALQLPNKTARIQILNQGKFEMDVFDHYIKTCEKEGVSFDLFHRKRPFMQAGFDPKYDQAEKPAAVIMADVPSGNNHIFLEHKMADEHYLFPDEAIRAMLRSYLFATSGAQGYPSSVNNTPCLYVMIQGHNLFETIILGCISQKEAGNLVYGKPAWRTNTGVVPKTAFASIGLLQGLTWQPRRLTFIEDSDGLIRRVYYAQGNNFKGNSLWRDPHVPYRLLKDASFSSIKPAEGRSLWRDLGAMAASKENRFGKRPQVIAGIPEDWRTCRINVIGLITSQATLVDTVYEEMLIHSSILNNEEYGEVLHRDLNFIEEINRKIASVASNEIFTSVVKDMQNNFLASARDFLFSSYLDKLSQCSTDDDYAELQVSIEDALLQNLYDMFEQLSLRLGYDAKNIVKQSIVRKRILDGYYKLRRERNHG